MPRGLSRLLCSVLEVHSVQLSDMVMHIHSLLTEHTAVVTPHAHDVPWYGPFPKPNASARRQLEVSVKVELQAKPQTWSVLDCVRQRLALPDALRNDVLLSVSLLQRVEQDAR